MNRIKINSMSDIRAIIAKRGLSYRKISEILGVSQNTFARRLQNKTLRITELKELCKILDCELDISVTFKDDE